MKLHPITLRSANAFVAKHHRHSSTVRGCSFCVAVLDDAEEVVGVAIAGRPLARMLADGTTIEILRVCTLGARNAPSKLYGAACRAAKAIGYQRAITYTLEDEHGSSLRGAGFVAVHTSEGGSWARHGRVSGAPLLEQAGLIDPRRQSHGRKIRWERNL